MSTCSTLLTRELHRARNWPHKTADRLPHPQRNPCGRCARESNTRTHIGNNRCSIPATTRPRDAVCIRCHTGIATFSPHTRCRPSPSHHRSSVTRGSHEKIDEAQDSHDPAPHANMRPSGPCGMSASAIDSARSVRDLPSGTNNRRPSMPVPRAWHALLTRGAEDS